MYSTYRLHLFIFLKLDLKLEVAINCATLLVTSDIMNYNHKYKHTFHQYNHLEVKGVVGVRHQAVLVGALQLEAMGDHAIRSAVLAIAVEFGQTVAISKLLEVLVGAVYSTGTKVLHYT